MLYVLYGEDILSVNKKARALAGSLLAKKPHADIRHITSDEFTTALFEELEESRGLFSHNYIILADHLITHKALKPLIKTLNRLAESPHIFIFKEGSLNKKTEENLAKYATKIQYIQKVQEQPTKKEFNRFALADALAARDRITLWKRIQEAYMRGMRPEEVHGILWWQVKALLLAKQAGSAEEAGLSPYPYKKAIQSLNNFSEEELSKLARTIAFLPHTARTSYATLGERMEYIALIL